MSEMAQGDVVLKSTNKNMAIKLNILIHHMANLHRQNSLFTVAPPTQKYGESLSERIKVPLLSGHYFWTHG